MAAITFDERKFQNAVLYILKTAPSTPGVTQLLKMLYFSDREHYRAHLAPITGAQYMAYERGPVVENYWQKFAALVQQGVLAEQRVPSGMARPKTEYTPLEAPDLDAFTADEIKTMDAVIAECALLTGSALSDKSHQDGPWSFAWNAGHHRGAIPYILFRWLDNLPDERDIEMAKARVSQHDVVEALAALQTA